MKLTVQVVIEPDGDTPTVVRDVFCLKRGSLGPDTVGLGLAEAKELLAAVQATMVDEQVNTAIAAQTPCPRCGTRRRHKDGGDRNTPEIRHSVLGRRSAPVEGATPLFK